MVNELQILLEGCRNKQRRSQEAFYNRFSPWVLGICRRYLNEPSEAEDLMITSMHRALNKLEQYQGDGSFEGWLRRITVNECLMFLRTKSRIPPTLEVEQYDQPTLPTVDSALQTEALLQLLDALPPGYRTVFNLFVIEGYQHHEIADQLGISINTSKSQLLQARKKLAEQLRGLGYGHHDGDPGGT